MTKREIFIQAYLDAAIWAEQGHIIDVADRPSGNNLTVDDFETNTLEALKAMAHVFYNTHGDGIDRARIVEAATDLWLTQNGHGAGFWDGDWAEPEASEYVETAKTLREVELYVGDDGKVYAMGFEPEGEEAGQ
jgi:hypothetical protein